MSDEDRREKARRRALRAARVVTLGLAMASPACGDSYQAETDMGSPPIHDNGVARVDADTPPPPVDLGRDLGEDLGSEMTDFGTEADMGECPTDPFGPPPETRECCEELPGGFWDEGSEQCLVAVPGPFVPPAMGG